MTRALFALAALAALVFACGYREDDAPPIAVPPLIMVNSMVSPESLLSAPPAAIVPLSSPRSTEAIAGAVPEQVRVSLPAPWAQPPVSAGTPPPDISAIAAVVVDEASGAVLYDKDAYRPLPPASTTKIATAILAIERGNLESEVTSDVDAALMPRSSVMGLRSGDRFTLRDLLYGLMLPSGNDAALAVGRHVSGSDAAFVADMNALLYRFGMDTSHFANPHGLGSREHYLSARDLAMLARYGMTLPEFRDILATYSYRASGSRAINMISANSFVFSYPGADSAKIGYTRSAGNTLTASATRNGHRLYVVVLNTNTRDADAARLLDWAFANYTWP